MIANIIVIFIKKTDYLHLFPFFNDITPNKC